jgi:hypothetical protein
MKRTIVTLLLVAGLLVFAPLPGLAGTWHGGPHRHPRAYHRHRAWYGRVVIAPRWWTPAYRYRYYPPLSYVGPRIVVQPPPVYVQQQWGSAAAAWYYCPSAQAYYPTVPACSEAWIAVAPQP